MLLGGFSRRLVSFSVFRGGGMFSGLGDGVAGLVNVTFGCGGFILVGERGGAAYT